jgi:hypothetical protein
MTKLNIYVLLAAGLLSVAGCDQHSGLVTDTTSKEPVPDSVKQFLVHVGIMRRDTANFAALCKDHLGDTVPVRAFTVRAVDLLTALGIPARYADSPFCEHKFARVYLGYRKDSSFRLFIVPVEGANLSSKIRNEWWAGRDIMLDSNGIAIPDSVVKRTKTDEENVLDLNAPCPNTCPVGDTGVSKL